MNSTSQDERGVRAALDTWYRGMEERDLELILSSVSHDFSSGGGEWTYDKLGDLYERVFAMPEYDYPLHPRCDVTVTVEGDRAVVEPVIVVRLNCTQYERFIFGREADGWRLIDAEGVGGAEPVELGLPDLGEEYVEQLKAWSMSQMQWVRETLRRHPPNGGDRMMRRHAPQHAG